MIFETYEDICKIGRAKSECFCGKKRYLSYVYCQRHLTEIQEIRADANDMDTVAWANMVVRREGLFSHRCSECHEPCPVDDFLCEGCRCQATN